MHEFTLKDPKKLGERDSKYGQSYWSFTHESHMPVKFNLMEGDVQDGSRVTAEEYTVRKSQKGTEYQQLRKVKVNGAPSSQPTLGGTTDFNFSDLKAQLDRIEAAVTAGNVETIDEVEDDKINLDDIPF